MTMTPKFELGGDFCTMHLPSSFIILCWLVRKLSCWQTNSHKPTHTQTNRFRWKHPTFFATLWRWAMKSNMHCWSPYCIKLGIKASCLDVPPPVGRRDWGDVMEKKWDVEVIDRSLRAGWLTLAGLNNLTTGGTDRHTGVPSRTQPTLHSTPTRSAIIWGSKTSRVTECDWCYTADI